MLTREKKRTLRAKTRQSHLAPRSSTKVKSQKATLIEKLRIKSVPFKIKRLSSAFIPIHGTDPLVPVVSESLTTRYLPAYLFSFSRKAQNCLPSLKPNRSKNESAKLFVATRVALVHVQFASFDCGFRVDGPSSHVVESKRLPVCGLFAGLKRMKRDRMCMLFC
jgi:hypothetical protein